MPNSSQLISKCLSEVFVQSISQCGNPNSSHAFRILRCFNSFGLSFQTGCLGKKWMASSSFSHGFSHGFFRRWPWIFGALGPASIPSTKDVEVVCAPPFVFLSEARRMPWLRWMGAKSESPVEDRGEDTMIYRVSTILLKNFKHPFGGAGFGMVS